MRRRIVVDEPERLVQLRSRLKLIVREAMNRRGISQAQLCKMSGLTQPAISQLLNPDTLTSIDRLLELLCRMGVDVDFEVRSTGLLTSDPRRLT